MSAVKEQASKSKPTAVESVSAVEHLEAFKSKVMKDAEETLLQKFPLRIYQLTELMKSPEFNMNFTQCHAPINIPRPDPSGAETNGGDAETDQTRKRRRVDEDSTQGSDVDGSKVLLLPNGPVKLNQTLTKLFEITKPLIVQQINDCNLLKMWIELSIPKVEDGNNFGVDIQEECLKEVSSAESEAALYLDQPARYYMSRAKMIVKLAKYPHVEDYRKTIEELDEKQYMNVKLVVRELFNNYAAIHDMLTKNLEKIKRPRTTNANSLY
ncbi:proteasome activator complex subunit 3 [Galendromus occidentalis]|uniref:Proteasome activator complex subunit 3 n=1 Tax=Galendromus occidentalis TaxID=34638 RepID=A0AAJ6VXA1_9ACAR|nr:proteasome activator complex subunit 3 [Galendromus occidentalis]